MQRDGQQIQEGFPALNLPGMGNFVIVDLCFRDVPGSGRERLPCCPFSFALIQLCPFNEEISTFWAGFGGDGVVIFKLQHAKKTPMGWEQLDLLDPKIPAARLARKQQPGKILHVQKPRKFFKTTGSGKSLLLEFRKPR